jgi:hypothetical protein
VKIAPRFDAAKEIIRPLQSAKAELASRAATVA